MAADTCDANYSHRSARHSMHHTKSFWMILYGALRKSIVITKSLWFLMVQYKIFMDDFVWCIEEIYSDYKITMILYGALQNHHDFVWCITKSE